MNKLFKDGVFIIAEIGINHNGDMEIAKQLIDAAKQAGCNAVKFQKRTIEKVYTQEELAMPRSTPFGETNGDLKRGLEFSFEQYKQIDEYCKKNDIIWFASPWDCDSVDFLARFDVPIYKIASASLTDDAMLKAVKAKGKHVILSVGMSTKEEIDHAVSLLDKENLTLMHCVCLYPPLPQNINLNRMATLKKEYNVCVGYSGHETDAVISAAAVALGACMIERHFTLDTQMWGSDHKASITPSTMTELISNIRLVEKALGSKEIKCLDEELPVKSKLRKI